MKYIYDTISIFVIETLSFQLDLLISRIWTKLKNEIVSKLCTGANLLIVDHWTIMQLRTSEAQSAFLDHGRNVIVHPMLLLAPIQLSFSLFEAPRL